MGFGTLFIGYFFLLNISYFNYTDLLAAAIMAMGLYRLGQINRPFRFALFADLALLLIGAGELVSVMIPIFSPAADLSAFTLPLGVARYLILAVYHLFLLLGIKAVAEEVGLTKLATRAQALLVLPLLSYLASALFDIPDIFPTAAAKETAIIAFAILLLTLLSCVLVLVTVYRCYAKICMPEDLDMPEKPSRFAFVNRMRERRDAREAERVQERADYLREKMNSKRKKKKK
ncbi:MAG TPA: hypothetical protein DDY70_06890 [Clostridiales bacterium]|nr:hypothetical protein [Clostridiales bacterium]